MKKISIIFAILLFAVHFASCASHETETTAAPTEIITTEVTSAPTPVPTPSPTSVPTPSPTPDEEYIFADKFFEGLVKGALGIGQDEVVYKSDILSIHSLNMFGDFLWINEDEKNIDSLDYSFFSYKGEKYYGNSGVKTFEDISNFQNLKNIKIIHCNIKDLSFLSQMHSLRDICLYGNLITDITPLENLVDLVVLDVRCNRLTNCVGIENLVNLKRFYYGDNTSLYDTTPLENHKQLTHLDLLSSQISDLSFLEGFNNLELLNLKFNNIKDITPLASLTNLENIDLSYNKISSIAPLAELPNLKYLYITNNPIKDMDSFTRTDLKEFEH